jgi:hypothetical protein
MVRFLVLPFHRPVLDQRNPLYFLIYENIHIHQPSLSIRARYIRLGGQAILEVKIYLITTAEQDLEASYLRAICSFPRSGTDGRPYAMYNWKWGIKERAVALQSCILTIFSTSLSPRLSLVFPPDICDIRT